MPFDFETVFQRRGTNSIKWNYVPDDVIAMGLADMDFASAPCITEALRARAENPLFGYTFPPKSLTEAILSWFNNCYSVTPEPDWIVPLSGIVPALAAASRITEGRLLTHTPNYSMILNAARRAGREEAMSTLPLINDAERYSIDYKALGRDTPDSTALYYLCNPHNPVGRVYSRDELERLAAIALAQNWIIVSDEIHCELVYEEKHTPYWSINDGARESSVTFYSPGKTYNLPGVPFAFAVIPNPGLRERFQKANYGMGLSGVFSYAAAESAYRDAGPWRGALIETLRCNRDFLEATLRERFPQARFPRVEGTYLQWIDFTPCGITDPAAFLLEKARVAVGDGKGFGAPGYVRLNFGCPHSVLSEALERIYIAFEREGLVT